jgi:hypothetical protein
MSEAERRVPTPFHFQYIAHRGRTGGLASSPGSCRIMPAEARIYGSGSSEMRVLLSRYESHGDVEPMVGLAVQFDTFAAAVEGCDALVATGVVPAGVWL